VARNPARRSAEIVPVSRMNFGRKLREAQRNRPVPAALYTLSKPRSRAFDAGHEHGQQESDGHSYADEQIEKNPSPWLDYAAR
jgi:hypothetical protein